MLLWHTLHCLRTTANSTCTEMNQQTLAFLFHNRCKDFSVLTQRVGICFARSDALLCMYSCWLTTHAAYNSSLLLQSKGW
jgi:hypothetical protein